MSRRTRTHRPTSTNTRRAGRGRTLPLVAATLTLAVTGIAATAWLTNAQEPAHVTTTTTATAMTTQATQPPTTTSTTASPTATNAGTAAATKPAPRQPAAQQPAAQTAPFTAGQRAFIDPVTGELRQPEHEELAAIAAAASAAAQSRRSARTAGFTASSAPETFGPDGSIEAVVPEDLHTFTVATRGPDGRISIEHAQGAAEAVKVMNANSAKQSQAPVSRAKAKEDRNDR